MAKNAQLQMHFYRSFEGGLNTKDASNVIADNQLAEARNAVLGKGLISKRDGTIKNNQNAPTSQISNPDSPMPLSLDGSGSNLLPTSTYYLSCDFADGVGRTTTGTSLAKITTSSTAGVNLLTNIVLPSGATSTGVYIAKDDAAITTNRTQVDFDTNISTYTAGQSYTLTVNAASYTAFDSIVGKIKPGIDYVTNVGVSATSKLGAITSVDAANRKVTITATTTITDSTSASWNGDFIAIYPVQRIGTVTSSGVVTYENGKTSGLTVEAAGNTLYLTISDVTASSILPQTSNTTSAVSLGMLGLHTTYKMDSSTEFINATNRALYRNTNGTLTQIPGAPLCGHASMVSYKDRSIKDVVLLADGGRLKAYDYDSCDTVIPHVPKTSEQTNPGLNDLNNLTNFRSIAIKKDRIFAAAHAEVKNRLSFCWRDPELGYAVYDYWPATFFIDVAADENDEIVALTAYRERLVIFCKHSVWELKGDGTTMTDYELVKVNTPKGCVSAGSVQHVEDQVFYLSEDGVYALQLTRYGLLISTLVSQPITPSLEAYTGTQKSASAAVYNKHKYILAYPDGTAYLYDAIFQAWTNWTNIPATCFGVLNDKIYYGNSSGFVYYFSPTTHNDDGQPIDFLLRTKNNDFGNPVYLKQMIAFMLKAKQHDIESSGVDVTIVHGGADFQIPMISTDTSLVWDIDNWDFGAWDFADVTTVRKYVSKQGRETQYVLRNNYVDQPCTIYQVDTQYMTLRV